MATFKQNNSFEKRLALSNRILVSGDRVPVIVEPGKASTTVTITRTKYSVPRDMSFGKLMAELRRNLPTLNPSEAVFYFLSNNTMPAVAMKIGPIYEQFKDEDGFLYINYICENTFG